MTIAATPRRSPVYAGNDSTTAFPFTFKVFSAADLGVFKTDAAGVLSALVAGSDYSVALNADQTVSPGGTITYPLSGAPLATGETLVAVGALPYDQTLALPGGGNFNPVALEKALDRAAIQIQQLDEIVQRTVRAPAGEALPALGSAADRANRVQAFDANGDPVLLVGVDPSSATALQLDLADAADGAKGDALVGVRLQAPSAAGRTQHAKNADYMTVADFREALDADDTESVERSLAHLGRAHFPLRATPYVIGRTIRAQTAVQLTQDRGVSIVAAPGFTGLAVTKDGLPFTLSAMVAVFTGDTINTQVGDRIGETGLAATIELDLDCAGNASTGVYAERAPGMIIRSSVFNCTDGIVLGPFCWGAEIKHPRVFSFTGRGVSCGFGSNGTKISNPEIWGFTVEGAVGIECTGNNNGFSVNGGYVEGVVTGFLASEKPGAVDISGVDFEVISGNCIKAVQGSSPVRLDGPIKVTSCLLSSTQEAIHNTNARIVSRGNRYGPPAATSGSHFFSANLNSVIVSDADSFETSGGVETDPSATSTMSLTMAHINGASYKLTNKKTVETSGAFAVDYGVYNYSGAQQETLSSSLEFLNSRQGGPTNIYSAKSVWKTNDTETLAGPVDVVKFEAGVVIAAAGGARAFTPIATGTHKLGNASFRWSEVFADTGTINTSDERHKQDIEDVPQAWLEAWADVKWQRFRRRDAVEIKGDGARWHVGLVAQRVQAAFAARGIDALSIGLLCLDKTQDGGDVYGVRYEEALALECAYLRWRADAL